MVFVDGVCVVALQTELIAPSKPGLHLAAADRMSFSCSPQPVTVA